MKRKKHVWFVCCVTRRHPSPTSYFTQLGIRLSPWLVTGIPRKGSGSSTLPTIALTLIAIFCPRPPPWIAALRDLSKSLVLKYAIGIVLAGAPRLPEKTRRSIRHGRNEQASIQKEI